MKQEEKELLLKDLCARLPFHVKVTIDFEGYMEVLPDDEYLQYTYRKNLMFILDYENKTIEDISKEPHILYAYPCTERFAMLRGYTYEVDYGVPVEFIKPYLRPMSSMTEEEREELSDYLCEQVMPNKIGITIPPNPTQGKGIPFIWMSDCMDWLNEHYFDYRGLIEKGLALEAPEGMYEIKYRY